MTQPSWRPLLRTPKSTITRILKSPAFEASRQQAALSIDDATALRTLADRLGLLDYDNAPLSAVRDRVTATIRFLRTRAAALDSGAAPTSVGSAAVPADSAARERLVVAALHYLLTPVDMVPDFRPGGYVDDVLLLSWAFGAAVNELEPFLDEDLDA